MDTERGLVISVPVRFDGTTFSMGGPLDRQELRASLLFWDKLDCPTNSVVTMRLDHEGEFLQKAGILNRTSVDVSVVGSASTSQMPGLCLYTHLAAFRQLDHAQPGVWSLGSGRNSVSFPEQDLESNRGVLVQLYEAIPVPDKEVPLEDILEFRNKRRAELLTLRHHLDAIYQRVISAGDGELALTSEVSGLEQAIADHIKTSKESKLKFRLMSLDVNLTPIAGTVAATTAYQLGLGTVGAMLAGVIAGIKIGTGVSLKWREPQQTPFRYISSFHKELF